MIKKILAVTVLCLSLPVHAGVWDSIATSGQKTVEPDAKYKLSTYGYDVRIYEYTPAYNPDYVCVFFAGNKNSSGAACYPKKVTKPKERKE